MNDDDFDGRLAAASDRLASLDTALRTGTPWPLAARFDHSPEASWGPPEILAHLEEMLAYWLGEAERIIDGPDELTAFGRVASDEVRIAIIGRDRTLPLRELVERVQVGIERWRRRWTELDQASRQRAGTHVSLGVLTVMDVATRFTVGHLEDHLDQLAAALGGEPPRG